MAAGLVDNSVDPPPSPVPNTQRMAHDHFQFEFRNALTGAAGRVVEDLVREPLTKLLRSTCCDDVELAIHHPTLFKGFESEDIARQTIMTRLTALASDPRDHRELSDDPDFQLCRVMPIPLAAAITAIAAREGWHGECLYQEVKCCAAFTENPGTRLKERLSDLHTRAPNIPCLRAADASARKTSLDGYGTYLLTESPEPPP